MTKTKKKPEKAAPSGRKSKPYQNRPSKSRPRRSPSDEAQLEETQAHSSKEKAPTRVPTKALPRLRPPSDNDSNINQESEDKTRKMKKRDLKKLKKLTCSYEATSMASTSWEKQNSRQDIFNRKAETIDWKAETIDRMTNTYLILMLTSDPTQQAQMSNAEHRRAKELLNMTPEDQAAALFYHLIKVNSRLEKLELAARTQVQPAGAHGKAHEPAEPILFDPTAPIRIEAFTFDNSAKISIKGVARRAMLEGDLESYSSRKNSQGDLIRKSLLSVTSKSLLLSRVLKDERNIFRGCLLQNIKTSTVNKKISGPVPSLTKLMSHIIETFFRKELALLADSLNPTHAAQSRTRIAYSRMECIRYAFGDQETNAAQWGLIDPQLEFLRGQSLDYYRVWSELIIKKDDALFGSGRQVFDEIPTDETFHVTHEEVLKLQATQQEERE
ncbi:hypothetical protein KEM48_005543 [Puccinia striiformis f. sp. tritici PST-130]|nr:hypothetical protein KEM48_005543 [Puccinia striiformis f. sp. tritici PST-130]